MRILIDVDGVLADFVGGLCRELNAMGYRRRPEDFRHWCLNRTLPPGELGDADGVAKTWRFCLNLEWYEGAIAFVKALQSAGEVTAVTAPYAGSTYWMHERADWLTPVISPRDVVFTYGERKRDIRGDVLIEDHPGNASAWLNANPEGFAILIDRPWNQESAQEFQHHERMVRARSYKEALFHVQLRASVMQDSVSEAAK